MPILSFLKAFRDTLFIIELLKIELKSYDYSTQI